MSEIRQIQLDGVNYDLVITEDEVSATAAAQSAAAAAQSATQAANSASAASTSATSAGTSATNAANSAVSAGNFATSAESSATDAESSASSASNSATAAASSASSASDSADTATAAATTATTKAGEASTSATNAATSATNAATSETNAETYATNAAASAAAAHEAEERAETIVELTIDTALSSTSRNPVENRVIKQALDNVDALPSQSGQNGKFLTTNGTDASWATVSVPTATSDLTNDSGFITIDDVPAPPVTSVNTKTGAVSLTASDIGAQASITASGILKGNGSGGITAAVAGTDYQAPISNNVTGSGTSGYIAKFNGSNTITNGPALGSGTTTFLRNDGSWATPTNTTYSAGSGLSLSGTTFNHGSSITAGTAGTSSATSGSTLAVPYVTYNATGHITATGTHTHTVTGFAASSHNHAASNINSGTLDIARIPTSNTQSNSTSTVPTSALVYNMNQTMTGLGWKLMKSVNSPGKSAMTIPIADLADKVFIKVVIYNTGSSYTTVSLLCGFTSSATSTANDISRTVGIQIGTSTAVPFFFAISGVAGGSGYQNIWTPQVGSSNLSTCAGGNNTPYLSFCLDSSIAGLTKVEIYAM